MPAGREEVAGAGTLHPVRKQEENRKSCQEEGNEQEVRPGYKISRSPSPPPPVIHFLQQISIP